MASNVGETPQVVLTGVSATGSGVADFDTAHSTHSLIVTTSAGVSAGTVVIELSHDNTNWYAPASNSISTTAASTVYGVAVTGFPARFVRARVSVGITGGTITASVASA